MRIPDETLQEITRRVGIVSVVSEHVQLRKAGKNHTGLCPFHSERTPSFTVSEEKGLFHCFGCGAGGSLFTFVMKIRGVSFPQAVEELARRGGVELPVGVFSPAERRLLEERDRQRGALEAAARFYERSLASPAGGAALRYLEERGLARESVARWRLGFAPGEGLARALSEAGVSPQTAERVGLLAPRRSGGGWDRFHGRIVFPVADREGGIVAFGARSLAGENPKYLNSPESPLFHKGKTLYGLHAAQESIRKEGRAVVVEGYFDVLLLHQAGFAGTVATLGTALGADHLKTLSLLCPVVVLLYDPDAAGERALKRALELTLPEGIEARVVELPDGLDPDEFVVRRGAEAFRVLLDGATPLLDALLARSRAAGAASLAAALAEGRRWAGLLRLIPSPVERDVVLARVASGLGVSESSLRAALKGDRAAGGAPAAGAAEPRRPCSPAEEDLLRILVQHPTRRGDIGAAGGGGLFREGEIRRVAAALVEGSLPLATILAEAEDERVRSYVASLPFKSPVEIAEVDRLLGDALRAIRLERLRDRKRAIVAELARAGRGAEQAKVRALLEEVDQVGREERELKGSGAEAVRG